MSGVGKLAAVDWEKIEQHSIVLTGGIGVGKSTISNHLRAILDDANITVFPEFIAVNPAVSLSLLSLKMEGSISTDTLQYYIADIWKILAKTKDTSRSKLVIYERLPEDCVEIFAAEAADKGEITFAQLGCLRDRINTIGGLPNYAPEYGNIIEVNNVDINSTIEAICGAIYDNIIFKQVSTTFVHLKTSTDIAMARISHRNRVGEDKYSREDIVGLTHRYQHYLNAKFDL